MRGGNRFVNNGNCMSTESSTDPLAIDENRHFRTDHLNEDLGVRTIRGGALTLTVQMLKFALSTAVTIVVARLLMPQDYGFVGMVMVLVNFLTMFQYLGLPNATVKWRELTHAQVSNLFWVNVGLSSAIALVVLAGSPLLARFYKQPNLVGIAAGYALVVFLTGLSIQHLAILQRQMRFVALAVIDVAALAIGLAVTIIAAWKGAGYWALVLNQLLFASVTIVGAWAACSWRPRLPSRSTGVRSMISYGGNLTGYNFTTFFAQNIDNALIGKFWGPYSLGIYSKAYQMLLTPIGQVTTPLWTVAVPTLSRLADLPERYRAAYLKIVEKIAILTMPAVVCGIATSDWLILLLLGPKWNEAARVFMFLGIAAIFQPISRTGLWLFMTQGRSREMFKWGIIGSSISVVSILVGLPWGATGVAAAYAITDLCLTTPLLFWYVGRRGPVSMSDVYRTVAPGLLAAAGSLIVLLAARPWIEISGSLITRLLLASLITLATSASVLVAMPAGRLAIQSLKEMLLLLLKAKSDFRAQTITK
jgi:O-antigen/teichoic acid export membrane protein